MPFRESDKRRAQLAFDAQLEDTIHEAEITFTQDRSVMNVEVRDSDHPARVICATSFVFTERLTKLRDKKGQVIKQPADAELAQMAQRFRQLVDAYVYVPDPPPPAAEE